MSRRLYPYVDSFGGNPKWIKAPTQAPHCTAPGCSARATRRPWIQVSWFRGDDVQCSPVCNEHSETAPALLLAWAEAWRAENKRKNDEAQTRAAARKAAINQEKSC